MSQPNGSMQRSAGALPGTAWARPAPRADPVAAVLLLIAGAIGVWQLLLPWRITDADPAPTDDAGVVSTTGWQVYRLLRAIPDPNGDLRAAMFAVLGVGVGGGALILLGITMMLPLNHRPLGVAALFISLLAMAGAGWMLIRARSIFDVGLFGLFSQAQAGWYLFLASGLIGLIGSWKALSTG